LSNPIFGMVVFQNFYPLLQYMQEIIEKYFMQFVEYVLVQIFARCQLHVSVIFLHKIYLLCLQPSLYLLLRGIQRSQHPLLYSHSLTFLSSDLVLFDASSTYLIHSRPLCSIQPATKPFVSLDYTSFTDGYLWIIPILPYYHRFTLVQIW
jgi:hypothetical protein